MKLEVKSQTLDTLKNLKGLWLLKNEAIMIITDYKYEKVEPPTEVMEFNTKVHKRKRFKKKSNNTPKYYLTDITIAGYNGDLKFIGSYNEEYCIKLIKEHNNPCYTLNLVDFRKAWVFLEEQIEAFKENIKK